MTGGPGAQINECFTNVGFLLEQSVTYTPQLAPSPCLYLLAYCSEINTGEIIEKQIIVIYRNRIQTVMVVQ